MGTYSGGLTTTGSAVNGINELHAPVWQSCDNVLQQAWRLIRALRQFLGHLLCVALLQELFLFRVDLKGTDRERVRMVYQRMRYRRQLNAESIAPEDDKPVPFNWAEILISASHTIIIIVVGLGKQH